MNSKAQKLPPYLPISSNARRSGNNANFTNPASSAKKAVDQTFLPLENAASNQSVSVILNTMPKPTMVLGISHYKCSPRYILTCCPDGHVFYRPVYCGKPWCARCGETGSPYHLRRISRAKDKIMDQTGPLGSLVVTIPPHAGNLLYDPKFLKSVRSYIFHRLQRSGIAQRGMIVWHWEGDRSARFNPHANFLFEGKFIKPEILNRLREDYTAWLKKQWGIQGFASADIHYEYRMLDAQKAHLLKYITRPTLHHITAEKRAVYKGLKGTTWFGKWKKSELETSSGEDFEKVILDFIAAGKYLDVLKKNRCACCGKPVVHKFMKHRIPDLGICVEMIPDQLYVECLWSHDSPGDIPYE